MTQPKTPPHVILHLADHSVSSVPFLKFVHNGEQLGLPQKLGRAQQADRVFVERRPVRARVYKEDDVAGEHDGHGGDKDICYSRGDEESVLLCHDSAGFGAEVTRGLHEYGARHGGEDGGKYGLGTLEDGGGVRRRQGGSLLGSSVDGEAHSVSLCRARWIENSVVSKAILEDDLQVWIDLRLGRANEAEICRMGGRAGAVGGSV